MNELLKSKREELAKVRKSIAGYLNRELDGDETEKLNGFNAQAVKLEAQILGLEQQDKADADEAERIEREKKEAVAEAVKAEAAKHRRLEMGDRAPYQSQFSETAKFDDLSAGEVGLVIDTLRSNGMQPSVAALKAAAIKVGELKNRSNTEDEEKGVRYVKGAFKAHTGIDATPEAISAAVKTSGDPMYTGGSLTGIDWVGTAYSQQIWEKIRGANVVVNRIPSDVIPDGFASKYWPLESTDPTWYGVAEASAGSATLNVPAATVTSSTFGTANKQITVGKIGARSLYSGEMLEDSLIPFASQLRAQLEKSGAEILEHLAIDGDSDTSPNTNINKIDATPAATDVFLKADGFRKLALVTNTPNSRSASGAFVVEDFKNTLKLMGVAGLNGSDPTQVAFVCDYNVMWAAMDLPELKTRDVFSLATIENGFLTRIYNTQVLYAYQMHRLAATAGYERKANTAGKVATGTPTNNTTGSILAVRFDQWKQAFKRRMTIETTRIANADAWEVVALIRWGMAYRDNEAAAITYNVGV